MRPNRTQSLEHECRAWEYRCRGWGQRRIAEAIAVSQPAVSKILRRVETRELKRLSESVERIKVIQTGELEHVIEETVDAWHRSKLPKKRAIQRTVSGGGHDEDGDGPNQISTQEAVERDGDPAYLYAAMNAMDRVRALWGLDVAPALQDPTSSVAELARDLLKRADAYDQRTQTTPAVDTGECGPADPGRAAQVPDGPESV